MRTGGLAGLVFTIKAMAGLNSNGLVIWSGASRLDHQPIVCILTGLSNWSANRKTGFMHQVWILRADLHPQEALRSGADVSICGNCPLRPNARGKRLCYVNPMTLGQVWKQYAAGRYRDQPISTISSLPLGVRLGAYGDPCAVPFKVWQGLVAKAPFHTGYTRQWSKAKNQRYRELLMASCFSEAEQTQAQGLGWRTYRVKGMQEPKLGFELPCPAAKEQTHPITCQQCKLCNGIGFKKPSKHIVVNVHGLNAGLFGGVGNGTSQGFKGQHSLHVGYRV